MTIIYGTNQNDNLPASGEDTSSDDTFFGLSGADTIVGGGGKDIMYGGNGADTFVIVQTSDVVAGERYSGGDGYDTLRSDSTDTVNFSAAIIDADVESFVSTGVDPFTRAAVLTTAQFRQFQSVNVTYGLALSGGGGVDMAGRSVNCGWIQLFNAMTLSLAGQAGATNVFGSLGNDVITAGDAPFDIQVDGSDGNDTLNGGTGDNLLKGGFGKDALNGGAGDDTFIVDSPSEIVAGESYTGGTGEDTLSLSPFAVASLNLTSVSIAADVEVLSAALVKVSLSAAQLGNFQDVNAAEIILTGAGTADLTDATVSGTFYLSTVGNTLDLTGVSSGQRVFGNRGADIVFGSDSGDIIHGAGGDDTLRGGAGNDQLTGDAGKDAIDGGAGDDSFIIGSQADIVAGESYTGGSGFDTLLVSTNANNLSTLVIAADIENLWGTGTTAFSMTAAQLDNFKSIVDFRSVTFTDAGAASLAGVKLDSSVTFNLNAAGNTLNLAGSRTHAVMAPSLHFTVNGGAGNDVITGGDGKGETTSGSGLADDTLNSGGGNDTIKGSAGNDFIYGGAGSDTMDGGADDDIFIVKSQAELQSGETYTGGNGFDEIDIQSTATLNLSALTIAGVEGLRSNGDVLLTATQLGAFQFVFTNDVTLTGAGVADLKNAEVYTEAFYLASAGNTLNLTGVRTQGANVFGGAGVDRISGTDLGDLIRGGGGNDLLQGGDGADTFLFSPATAPGVDRILDFSGTIAFDGTGAGEGDKIGLTGLTGTFDWIGAATFDGSGNSQARFAGNGVVQIDLNGNGKSDLGFVVNGMTQPNLMTESDFVFS